MTANANASAKPKSADAAAPSLEAQPIRRLAIAGDQGGQIQFLEMSGERTIVAVLGSARSVVLSAEGRAALQKWLEGNEPPAE